jgi:hypothetical protein
VHLVRARLLIPTAYSGKMLALCAPIAGFRSVPFFGRRHDMPVRRLRCSHCSAAGDVTRPAITAGGSSPDEIIAHPIPVLPGCFFSIVDQYGLTDRDLVERRSFSQGAMIDDEWHVSMVATGKLIVRRSSDCATQRISKTLLRAQAEPDLPIRRSTHRGDDPYSRPASRQRWARRSNRKWRVGALGCLHDGNTHALSFRV